MVDINEAINDVEAEARSKELEAQIEQLKQDVASLTSTLASLGSATLHQVGDKASDAIRLRTQQRFRAGTGSGR
ncbi:hypothetical protein ACQY1F_16095 [Agrobacterium vitis]|uniref:hypothetical protein n=1 Tax=Agrobacterium vitis TaxID=373 RepID=UPI003D2BE359